MRLRGYNSPFLTLRKRAKSSSPKTSLHINMNITSQDPGFGTKEGVHEPTTADLVVSDMLPIFIFCFIILIFPVWYRAREEGQCDGLFDTLTCLRKKEQSTIKDGVNKLGKELKNEYLYGLEGAIEELDPQELNEMIYYQSILKVLFLARVLLCVPFYLVAHKKKSRPLSCRLGQKIN